AGAPGYAWLLVCAALAGVGNSAINQAGARGVVLWFPPSRRGTAMGLRQTGNMLGGALAAALVPALGVALGWRAGAAVAGALVLASALGAAVLYAEPPGAAGASRRGPGLAGLLALARQPALLTLLV